MREEFGEADLVQELLGLAIGALRREALGVVDEFAQALHIGREPGEPVGGVLVGLDQLAGKLAVLGDAGAHARERVLVKRLDGGERLFASLVQSAASSFVATAAVILSFRKSMAPVGAGPNSRLTCRHLAGDATGLPAPAGLRARVNFSSLPPSCPRLSRASTPDDRETHRAETICSANVLRFTSCRRVDGRDKRGHDAVRGRVVSLD